MTDIKAYMSGPKAENLGLMRQLINEALDDHMYWRRNFYPDDCAVISSTDQRSTAFAAFEDRLRDLLFRFLSDAKAGVPFFSPRYIGHMNTDLLIPALVGYFGSMLYNQNNVADESSPVTVRLEQEVIDMLARMVGLPDNVFGYLCSGGTAANIYGLWVARNLRAWPLALRLAMERSTEKRGRLAALLRAFSVRRSDGATQLVEELSAWDLFNLPLSELYEIRIRCFEHVRQNAQVEAREARKAVEDFVSEWTLQRLGQVKFHCELEATFPNEAEWLRKPVWILTASNTHYSWPKAADLLGMGQGAIQEIQHSDDFTLNPTELRSKLNDARKNRQPVLAIVGTFGSTEEGSLDDIDAIEKSRRSSEELGLTAWLHVDACYGGYLGSLARCREGDGITSPEQLEKWLLEIGKEFGLDDGTVRKYVSPSGSSWLSWRNLLHRVDAIRHADSISIDPHKLGYIPYPAGAVLLRDKNARELASFTAPYLWIKDEALFSGRYTLEGSRAGAAAAACWLAHKAVPLSQQGHGKLIAASVLATRQLYITLNEMSHQKIGIAFLNSPHLNMLIYLPYHRDSASVDQISEVVRRVKRQLEPTRENRDFMVVGTDVNIRLTAQKLREMFQGATGDRLAVSEPERDHKLPVLRSVVMGPLSLNARHHPTGKTLFQLYAERLCVLAAEHYRRLRNEQNLRLLQEGGRILLMDDNKPDLERLQNVFDGIEAPLGCQIVPASNVKDAKEVIADYDRPLRRVVLDIDMGRDHPDGGYEVLAMICRRNDELNNDNYRVGRVVFLTAGDQANTRRCREITQRFGHAPTFGYIEKHEIKSTGHKGFEEFRDGFIALLVGDGSFAAGV